MRNHMIDL